MTRNTFFLLGTAASLLLTGMQERQGDGNGPARSAERATACYPQNRSASKSVQHHACKAVYAQADAHFRSQPLSEWIMQCEQFEVKLGLWDAFQADSAIFCGKKTDAVCLSGTAIGGKGRYDVIIGWLLTKSDARLIYVSFGRNGENLGTMPPREKQLYDPLPRNSTKIRS